MNRYLMVIVRNNTDFRNYERRAPFRVDRLKFHLVHHSIEVAIISFRRLPECNANYQVKRRDGKNATKQKIMRISQIFSSFPY